MHTGFFDRKWEPRWQLKKMCFELIQNWVLMFLPRCRAFATIFPRGKDSFPAMVSGSLACNVFNVARWLLFRDVQVANVMILVIYSNFRQSFGTKGSLVTFTFQLLAVEFLWIYFCLWGQRKFLVLCWWIDWNERGDFHTFFALCDIPAYIWELVTASKFDRKLINDFPPKS